MLAVDTNIVVRALADDDPIQSPRARALLIDQSVFVCTTVFLECEWALRRSLKDKSVVLATLRALAGMPNVTLEEPDRIRFALDATIRGFDFADALNLAAAGDCTAFVTFDRDLHQAATMLGGTPVREP